MDSSSSELHRAGFYFAVLSLVFLVIRTSLQLYLPHGFVVSVRIQPENQQILLYSAQSVATVAHALAQTVVAQMLIILFY